MSKTHMVFRAAFLVALLAPVTGCSDGLGSDPVPVTLMLTDAPGDLRAAVVTVSEIYLQGDGDDDGRVVLMDEPTTVNLLDLANEAVTLVADVPVPAGRYAQLRFVITGGYIEVETDGGGSAFYASSPGYQALPSGVAPGELQMPSFGSSGLKVLFADGALDLSGDATLLLIDFDVNQSFGHDTGTDRWVLSPVIHGAELSTSGSVSVAVSVAEGVTLPAAAANGLADFSAVLRDADGGETPVALTDSDSDGVFTARFVYLMPGDYSLYLTAPAGMTFTTSPASDAAAPLPIGLGSGEQEEVTLEVSSAM